MNVLELFLKKKNIKSFVDLNEEERKTYKEWEEQLSGRKLTDEDVQTFLNQELDNAVTRLTEINLSKEAEIFRKVEVQFIKKVIAFLKMPELEQKLIEKSLIAQL